VTNWPILFCNNRMNCVWSDVEEYHFFIYHRLLRLMYDLYHVYALLLCVNLER
jgi:hypothetical protein